MGDNRMMETSMNSSQGPRKIHPRRKPTEAEKLFKCQCGKSYLSNESLYTHRKTKHPDEIAKPYQVPQTGDVNINNLERDDNVKRVIVNNDTFNMLTKSAFLNFFKEMKEFADSEKEILKLFHSEKKGYTLLNMQFLEQGNQKYLNYLIKALRLNENIPDIRDIRLLNGKENQWFNINIITSSLAGRTSNFAGLGKQDSFDLGMNPSLGIGNFIGGTGMTESYNGVQNIDLGLDTSIKDPNFLNMSEWGQQDQRQNNLTMISSDNNPNKMQQVKLEDIPEYYRDFYTIAKEIIKPMTEKFAMEMCYLFDKLIEMSSQQLNAKMQEYKEKNQVILLQLIQSEQNLFPKFNGLSKVNRESLIEKFLFNLAHLFQTSEPAPNQ
ncbi:zinc finger, C2H2 type family protein (macronuclear) [Tetrahymena thermophila SB210]|uniref:Zinc finger, C2H2 type family protein n=1 Tax=Tetrahymena thermophila (strain SB210) TaxID=312017 RepID=Q23RV1_TETTS|nr:zinc finger, C2H2 type family protein [Tetrahymena thermophila SB210]EAR99288.1 zinc finger, C2H2 type family protein [Tetrahymena thermophila SB210]|eukprot:XP_001019533.1 zinc finger, C2H2 type family protein [Tetrahymena thermophila SB210]